MIPCRSVSCSSHAATQAANQSTSQSGNFLLQVRQPAAPRLVAVAGGIGGGGRDGREGWGWGAERGGGGGGVGGDIKGGGDRGKQMNTFMQTHFHLIA